MPNRQLKFTDELRKEIKIGVDTLADAVKITLGPMGKNVIVQNPGSIPHVTKDGVTVASSIQLENAYRNIGCSMVIDAASRTVRNAGDGTTTVTILVQSLIGQLFEAIKDHKNIRHICMGMDKALVQLKEIIEKNKKPVKDNTQLKYVATVSANNDETIGKLIYEIFDKIGRDGLVFTDASKSAETYHEFTEGIKFNSGFSSSSHMFVNKASDQSFEYEQVNIMFVGDKINSFHELVPVLSKLKEIKNDAGASRITEPLLIIARDFEPDVVASAVANLQQGVKLCIIKSPVHVLNPVQFLEDLAIMTGGKVIGMQNNIPVAQASAAHLGRAKRVRVRSNDSTIFEGAGDAKIITERFELIDNEIKAAESDYLKDDLKRRRSKLRGNIAILYIGAASDSELHQKKDRIDDAIAAVQASLDEGIIISTASFLLRAAEELSKVTEFRSSSERKGFDIVRESLSKIFYQVLQNANMEPLPVHEELRKTWGKKTDYERGYNLMSGEIENLFTTGIIDPAKVLRCALENSISVASMMVTTDCAIVNVEEEV